jgi:protein-disulfide isomerase
MGPIARRILLRAALALSVWVGTAVAQTGADDIVIGQPGARATLVEYGSAACGHCRAFEQASWETLKREYIDAGRIRFVFREMFAPVSPDGSGTIEAITLAMYQVSRCDVASPAQYFERLHVFFERQPSIFASQSMAELRERIVAVGADSGLTRERALSCMSDASGQARLARLGRVATENGVTGTPTFFLNGQRLDTNALMTPEALRQTLDAALASPG